MKINLFKENLLEGENDSSRDKILKSAWIALNKYKDFINNSIRVVQRQGTIEIDVTKITIKGGENFGNIAWEIDIDSLNNKEAERVDYELFSREIKYLYLEKPEDKKAKQVSILDRNAEERYLVLVLDLDEDVDVLYLKANDYQLRKQRDAVNKLLYNPNKSMESILHLFNSSPRHAARFFEQNTDRTIEELDIEWKVLTDGTRNGTDQQRNFVYKALRANDFALLEGPPGSGKTTAIIELILQLIEQGKRILLVSATHVAVDNVIHRILTSYKEQCEGKVVPLRIGDKGNIRKESVKPYRLQTFISKKKKEIKERLDGKKNKTESQQKLYNYLKDSSKGNQEFDDIILKSANLVGGTMIGVLQHPDIKTPSSNEVFDVMIVDESSKVTFLDFLVPALHAKKWILVGDVQQLSPYVEDDYVNETIDGLISSKEEKERIAYQFEFRKDLIRSENQPWGNYIKVLITNDLHHPSYNDLAEEVYKLDDNFEASLENIATLNGADVVLCKDSKKAKDILAKHLWFKTKVFEGYIDSPSFKNRQKHLHNNRKSRNSDKYYYNFESVKDKTQKWKELVGSRLGQYYEYRFNQTLPLAKEVKADLDILVPDECRAELDNIRKVALPSILELLQIGIGTTKSKQGYVQRTIIYEGFKKFQRIVDLKFQSLEYQHRMNDVIANTSRIHFYESKNLITANTVLERTNLVSKYKSTEKDIIWVTNRDKTFRKKDRKGKSKNINPTEVTDVEKELIDIIHFARLNPKINEQRETESYEVAVLTFYRQQEYELKKMLKNLTKQNHKNKFFSKENIKITLCTVDKFQGDEADMVLLSFAIFKRRAFYNNSNRLNVALTRARYKLILFGNKSWLENNAMSEALKYLASEYDERIISRDNKNKK